MRSNQSPIQKNQCQLLEHLVIVPGHALLSDKAKVGQDLDYYLDEGHWILEPFQKGEVRFYVQHVQAGLKVLTKDPQAVLVFSGGRTRSGAKKWSEAKSYLAIAKSLPQWRDDFSSRIMTDNHARDSIQNVCFPLFLYHETYDAFPKHVLVVNWKFKADRFDLHRQTLGVSSNYFEYLGVNNPSKVHLAAALKGEEKTLNQFKANPFGLSEELKQKRAARDPHLDRHPYDKMLRKFFRGTAYYKANRDKFPQLVKD